MFWCKFLRETWLSADADISMFHIPVSRLIHQGFRYTEHGVFSAYIKKWKLKKIKIYEKYLYTKQNLRDKSYVWMYINLC